MAAMNQRKKLSAKGRILATGLSIGAAGVLAGVMAITDHTASASPSPDVVDAGNSDSGVSSPSAAPFTPSQQDPASADACSTDAGPADAHLPAAYAFRRELMPSHFWWYTARGVAWSRGASCSRRVSGGSSSRCASAGAVPAPRGTSRSTAT